MNILITGAGPTGLTLATELARRGIIPTLIDKKEELSEKSKAIVLHSRTLELLEHTGITPELLRKGIRCNGVIIHEGRKEMLRLRMQRLRERTAYDYFLNVSQSDTEALLAERLGELGVHIHWNTTLEQLEQCGDSVTATLKKHDDAPMQLAFDYVIGCDGDRSTVREQVGIDFPGDRHDEVFFTADVNIRWDRPNDQYYFWLTDNGAVFTAPLPGRHNYRIILQQPRDETESRGDHYYDNADHRTIEELQRLLDRILPGEMEVYDPKWIGTFDIPHHVAARYRRGRVLIAGDACHLHPPLGGQGMNASIQDACNLGWKLALVAQEIAPDSLLDTYERERLPVGQDLVESTLRGFEVMVEPGRLVSSLRNRLLQFATGISPLAQLAVDHMSMQDINYPDSPLNYTDTAEGVLDFHREGPAPGMRAPEATVFTDQFTGVRLLSCLDPQGFTLLFFAGTDSDANTFFQSDTYAGYATTADRLRQELPLSLTAYVVSRRRPDTAFNPPLAYLHDSYHEAERAYRTDGKALAVLIRPDGHVALITQHPEVATLSDYFSDYILLPSPALH